MGLGLHQVGVDGVTLGARGALHHCQIAPAGDNVVPAGLEQLFGGLVLGEHQHPGGVPVQPVDDKNAVVNVLALHVVGDHVVGRAHLLLLVAHAQKLGGLVDHNEVLVLKEDGEGEGVLLGSGHGQDGHHLAGGQGRVELGGGLAVHRHQLAGEQGLDVVAALPLEGSQQKGKERGGLGYRVAGLPALIPVFGVVWLHGCCTAFSSHFSLLYHNLGQMST